MCAVTARCTCYAGWGSAVLGMREKVWRRHAWGAGTLPPQYANLTSLKNLDVTYNFLTGRLPAEYFTASAFSNSTFMEARCVPPRVRESQGLRGELLAF